MLILATTEASSGLYDAAEWIIKRPFPCCKITKAH